MCWACYTPLTAGAGASMGAGARGGATTFPQSGTMPGGMGAASAPVDEREKKKIDPRLFFAGGGLALAGLILAFTSGAFGGNSNKGEDFGVQQSETMSGGSVTIPGGNPSVPLPPPPPPPPNNGGGGGQTQTQQPAVYSMIVPPNPRYKVATMAITAAPGQSGNGATLARKAQQDLQRTGKWTSFQIAVYTDANSPGATAFRDYVNARRGAPLSQQDISNLQAQNAWVGATAFYQSGGRGGGQVLNLSNSG